MKALISISLLVFLLAPSAPAEPVRLETVLQRTVENNPEIQRARIELERAAGERLVFHSVALPTAIAPDRIDLSRSASAMAL
jgi:hypothetical protein